MATIASLQARHDTIVSMFHEHAEVVREIQQQALAELLPLLSEELSLSPEALSRARLFLEDQVTVFRFCRRARFSVPAALKLLHATLAWRLSSLSLPPTLDPLYATQPLFFFHPSLSDKFGRPCAVLNLKLVSRTEDGELEALKEFVRVGWEVGRRWLSDLSAEKGGVGDEVKVQMVVIVDLEGAGMSNLEVELLPFFMDLLKNHFPGMVGAIFVLNYGWMYAGMWQLAKRVLPNTALERILFPSKADLLQFFSPDNLLVEHGGNVSYTYTPSNPLLTKYTLPPTAVSPSSAYPSPLPSRSPSTTSLSSLAHHPPPPAHPGLTRRPSGLSMTTLRSDRWNGGKREAGGSGLKRVTSFAELQERLREVQVQLESDSEGSEVEGEAGWATAGEGARSGETSAWNSRETSRATSRNVSRGGSRETSPRRKDGEVFSTRAVRFSAPDHVSPYNTANPYYGYPAYLPHSSLDPSGIPRPHYHRRRKRDLMRTLTYLAVLRFLALHRQIQTRLSALLEGILRITGVRRLLRVVRGWDTRVEVDGRIVWVLVALVLLRSPSAVRGLRGGVGAVRSGLPRMGLAGAGVVQCVAASPGRVVRKRDWVRGLIKGGK